jgi:hypothetical protein
VPTLALGRELVVIVSGAGAGGACVIVKIRAVDTAPPVLFRTMTKAVMPAAAMSVAGICAVSWVAFTKVVVRAAPFQSTVALLTKLLPFTVSVKAGPPAAALFGEREVNVGVGAGAACTVSVVLPVLPVPDNAADMVVVPADLPVASPLGGGSPPPLWSTTPKSPGW